MNKVSDDDLRALVAARVKVEGGCWLWQGSAAQVRRKGYDRRRVVRGVKLRRAAPAYPLLKTGGKAYNVRRLVYRLWGCKPPLRRATVRATCGNSLCVNPAHLVRGERQASPGPPRRTTELTAGV